MGLILFLGLVFLILGLHPYLTYPLSLYALRRRPPRPNLTPAPKRSVAICMCAYNEAGGIVAKAEALLAMAAHYGSAQVFVYVDGSSDDTAALLEPYRDRINLTVSAQRRGKTFGMKQMVAQSQSEVLAFTDANVVAPVDALDKLVRALDEAPDVRCASARLRYTNGEQSDTAAAGAAYWSLEETIKGIESDRVGLIGVDGALFVIDRSAYPELPDHLIDDLYVSLSVLIAGQRVVTAPDVVVEERGAVHWREEFRRKERISCQAWNVHRTLWPQLREMPAPRLYAYVSHRVLKWFSPFTLLAAGLCFMLAAMLVLSPMIVVGGLVLAVAAIVIGLAFGLRPFRIVGMMLLSLVGVAAGILQSMILNRTYTIWDPAESVHSRP